MLFDAPNFVGYRNAHLVGQQRSTCILIWTLFGSVMLHVVHIVESSCSYIGAHMYESLVDVPD